MSATSEPNVMTSGRRARKITRAVSEGGTPACSPGSTPPNDSVSKCLLVLFCFVFTSHDSTSLSAETSPDGGSFGAVASHEACMYTHANLVRSFGV